MGVNPVLYYVGGGSKFNVLNPFYAPLSLYIFTSLFIVGVTNYTSSSNFPFQNYV